MTTPVPLTGRALGEWMQKKVIGKDGKVSMPAAVLVEARGMLSKTTDMTQLRDSVQALTLLAYHLGKDRNAKKAGEQLLNVLIELTPRFERWRTELAAKAPAGQKPVAVVPAGRLRGAVKP